MNRFAARGAAVAAPAALAAALVAVMAGCGGPQKKAAAVVNNTTITQDAFLDRVQHVSVYDLAPALQPGMQGRMPATSGDWAFLRMIQETLMEQLGAEKGIKPTEAQITDYVAFAKKYQSAPGVTLITPDPTRPESLWRQEAKLALIQRGIAMQGVKFTPQDMQAEYDSLKPQLTTTDQYHLRLIVATTKQKAAQALDALKKGVPFETVALRESEDPASRQRAGDIGVVSQEQLPPQILGAVKDLKPNDYTHQVIQIGGSAPTQPGAPPPPVRYTIAQLVEKMPGQTPPLDQVKYIVEWSLLQKKDPNFYQRLQGDMEAFRKKAHIEAKMKEYEHVVQSMQAPAEGPVGAAPAPAPGAAAPPVPAPPAGK